MTSRVARRQVSDTTTNGGGEPGIAGSSRTTLQTVRGKHAYYVCFIGEKCAIGGNQEGSESNLGTRIETTPGSADQAAAPDGSLCSKDPINLSQETLARLQSATAARAASADAVASLVHQEGNAGNAPSSSNPIASTIAEGIIAGAIDTVAASSARADLNGSSRPQHAETVALLPVHLSGTAQPPQPFPRSPMTAQQHGASTSADQQPAAAHAWYNAVLAAGHTPDAFASILSLINAEAARGSQAPRQPPLPASAPAPLSTGLPPPEAQGNMAATPLSAKLRQILQAGAMKQEHPKDTPSAPKHLISQPQQVTTGDMHAHLHPSIRAHVSPLPDAPQPAGAKPGPRPRADPTPPAWPQPDAAQPSSQLPQQGSAKSGSEVLKRTFEARPESPSKRLRFQGGIAELQQELSRRALEGGTPSSLPQEAFPAAAEADARSRRPRPHDLQAKDLTDMVRRDSAPVPRSESTFLKHLMDSIPREGGAAAAAGDAAPAWPLQPAERSRSGLSRMVQPPAAAAPPPAPAPASAAPTPRLSATQLLQRSLISELTGQAPRRLLDQLDPGTLGLILTTGGAPAAPSPAPQASVPPGPLPVSAPVDPLASHALHLLQRAAPPEPQAPAPASRPTESPLSPQTAEQLYMRLENAIGAQAAAALISGQKPVSQQAQQVQPLKPPPPTPQPQLLDVLHAFIAPGSALPPLHMRRDAAAPLAVDAARDSHAAAQALSSRPPLNVTLPAPSHAPRSAPAPAPASFASAAQPSRRKQSPMLSLSGDRSAGLRAPRAVDASALPHFGAPQLLTSSDLAKPVAPLLGLGAVDLRSGPAASLATPLQQPPPAPAAAAAPPARQPPPPAAAVEPSVSSIIEALTGTGPMSPQMRQRTLAAIGQYISDQGQAAAERSAAHASAPAAEVPASAAAPAHTPPPDTSKPPVTAAPPSDTTAAAAAVATPAPKAALSMSEDELQAAELLMALSGAAAPVSAPAAAPAAASAPPAKSDPKPSPLAPAPEPAPTPPTNSVAPASTLAPAGAPPTAAAGPAPGQCLGELGSPAAEVLRQQMMSMLGMAEPPIPPSPSQGGTVRPHSTAADGATVAVPLRPAPASAAAPPPADAAAAAQQGGMAEAAAADLLSAYQVDSWRVDGRRRSGPGPGR